MTSLSIGILDLHQALNLQSSSFNPLRTPQGRFFFFLAKRFFIAGWEGERAESQKREAGGARA
jgi:hypothetical protein